MPFLKFKSAAAAADVWRGISVLSERIKKLALCNKLNSYNNNSRSPSLPPMIFMEIFNFRLKKFRFYQPPKISRTRHATNDTSINQFLLLTLHFQCIKDTTVVLTRIVCCSELCMHENFLLFAVTCLNLLTNFLARW